MVSPDARGYGLKKLYGKPHISGESWGMAYTDYIMKANIMGSVNGPTACPYEL